MAKPICFHCGRHLMYVTPKGAEKSVPVWIDYTDPAGHRHKLHIDCAMDEENEYKTDGVKHYG